MTSGARLYKLGRITPHEAGVASGPANVEFDIAAFRPPKVLQPFPERRDASLPFRISLGKVHEYCNSPHAIALLCVCNERPSAGYRSSN